MSLALPQATISVSYDQRRTRCDVRDVCLEGVRRIGVTVLSATSTAALRVEAINRCAGDDPALLAEQVGAKRCCLARGTPRDVASGNRQTLPLTRAVNDPGEGNDGKRARVHPLPRIRRWIWDVVGDIEVPPVDVVLP